VKVTVTGPSTAGLGCTTRNHYAPVLASRLKQASEITAGRFKSWKPDDGSVPTGEIDRPRSQQPIRTAGPLQRTGVDKKNMVFGPARVFRLARK
jgi:hypothetical protein